ncbi:hypothetical protein M0R45_009336 [Rubus argutus]|uniref:Uncharacterized protein n=1 Tax=Rubus argutus TaxID=59490 RepID=A0AAW1Y5R4_RUBAR
MPPPPIDSKPNQSIHQAKPETPSANSLGKSGLPATTIRARGKSGFSAGVVRGLQPQKERRHHPKKVPQSSIYQISEVIKPNAA